MSNPIYNLIILKNEDASDHLLWEKSCVKYSEKVSYKIVDLTLNTWLDEIQQLKPDCLLARPGNYSSLFKQMYDERLYILNKVMGYPLYPSYEELFIYENKRLLSYWLKGNKMAFPKTDVFYYKKEANVFIGNAKFPLVAKVNIGASGSGVQFLINQIEAQKYIEKAFSRGITRRSGPNLRSGNLIQRILKYMTNFKGIIEKLKKYKSISNDIQKGIIILQEYIPHEFEWRTVRIGDSFFAHKKIVKNQMASGSLLKGYDNPPLSLLSFLKLVTDKARFLSQAVDIFEIEPDCYLINEMQTIFGQSDTYQMLVDGVPGRYCYIDNQWVFEAGDFNSNESFDLRLEHVLSLLQKGEF